MLVFLTSDVAIAPSLMEKALKEISDDTFNMISVDGDTSTNDTVAILANGLAGNKEITEEGEDFDAFLAGLRLVMTKLCRKIAADGEGATKLLECSVTGAKDKANAKKVAKSVISSTLTKAAMFGADANWGRILCAIGYAGAELDIRRSAFPCGREQVKFRSAKTAQAWISPKKKQRRFCWRMRSRSSSHCRTATAPPRRGDAI